MELAIRNATIVDGTGPPPAPADLGIDGGRIVAVAEVGSTEPTARRRIDATGLVVCPGVHRPAHPLRRPAAVGPAASPSNVHGVTTIIAGNCGFTLAPRHRRRRRLHRRDDGQRRGHAAGRARGGRRLDWSTFGEYLDRLDGNLGVNAGFLVGHCAIRRRVMGTDAVGNEADAEQIEAMRPCCAESHRAPAASASPPRWPAPTPTATASPWPRAGPPRTRCSRWRRWSPSTRAPRWSSPPTAASTASRTTRSTS